MTSVLILLSGFDPGTYFIEDDGDPTNGIAQLRGPDDSVIFFNIPTEFLTVTASAGRSVVFNLTESFGAADINVGSLTNSAENPDFIQVEDIAGAGDVLLVSNSSITEVATDAAPDIVASTLILSGSTGIGTGANALETQVGTIEAETDTGGINLTNYGNVIVGGLTDDANGLLVATSGNLTFTNFGSISVNEETGFESIRGGNTSGNVVLIANGFDSDISSLVDVDFIAAPGGAVLLQAGRDVSLGTQGTNFDNDVRARGSVTITAGRDLNVDGFADLAANGFGAGTSGSLTVNAGRDINVLNSTGTDASLGVEGTGGGNTTLNAGPNGFVRLLASSGSVVFSNSGNVFVNADRVVINATAGVSADSGAVTIAPRTAGWNMDLGSATDGAFALELSDAELDRITTPTLNLGSNTTGVVTVSSSISPALATDLFVRSSTDINLNAGVTTVGALSLRALDNVFQVAASAINASAVTVLVDAVDDDAGVGGIGTFNGTIVAGSNSITGNLDDDTINGSGEGNNINGAGGNDVLRGFGGNDSLTGGTGIDTMSGGLGDDFYFVDNGADQAIEAVGEGRDKVFADVSYTLGANVDDLTLQSVAGAATGTGNDIANAMFGNEFDNVLIGLGGVDAMTGNGGNDTIDGGSANDFLVGNDGNDILNGGLGADDMTGGLGNDSYFVDSAGDDLHEVLGEGRDIIFADFTFTLTDPFEDLTLQPVAGAANGTGTAFNNKLTGNDSINTLLGLAGDDKLIGNGGNDILDGGTAADEMTGGLGNDTYFIDNAGDHAIEVVGGGSHDTVISTINYTLEANVEDLTLQSAGVINGTGNTLNNIINGTSASNTLSGGDGNDTLLGSGGSDIMNGGFGNDTLNGGTGVDQYFFTTALGPTNVDTIQGFGPGNDKIVLENSVFTALAAGALPANAFHTGSVAADADDRILYDPATGILRYDADGNGAGASIQFATLATGLAMSEVDFAVI